MPRRERRGPRPALTEEHRRRLAEERRSRARVELLEVRPREGSDYPILTVSNPMHGTRYRVHLPAYPELEPGACECTDFAQRGVGTCKHLEAARSWVVEHRSELVRPRAPNLRTIAQRLWKAIDRGGEFRDEGSTLPRSVLWRRRGAILYEHAEARPTASSGPG